MRTNPTRLFLAVVALSFPAVTFAQSGGFIVPPPTPPGSTRPAAAAPQPAPAVAPTRTAAPTTAPASTPVAAAANAPRVMPADSVSGVNPASSAAGAGSGGLIDIALPSAPKPEAAPVADLKPSAPTVPAQKAAAAHAKRHVAAKEAQEPKAAKPLDPYAGIVGTPVSDAQLNRFVFPEAVEGVFFAEGAPLPECAKDAGPMDPCKPVFLNGRRMMLLQLRAGAKGPIQMLVHLRSGRMETMNLMPSPGPGAIVRVNGAEDGASDTRLAEGKANAAAATETTMADSEQNIALLSRFAKGDIPGGFDSENVGAPTRYEYFDVIPMAQWSNGANWRVHLMQVRAFGSQPVAINAGLFRGERVRAIALDRETITEQAPAQLYLLEYVPTEQQ